MPVIQPFAGWRYNPAQADYAKVSMPPYDVVGEDYQNDLYKRDPKNSVRIIYGKVFDTDTDNDNRYTRAATHLDQWREEGLLIQDKPAVYLYEQEFTADGVTYNRHGFFARVLLSEWGEAGVFPHEKTLSGPKADRLNLMKAVKGNPGPVFGLLSDKDETISQKLASLYNDSPLADFIGDDKVRNKFWVLDDPEAAGNFCDICSNGQIFIADGHHRYETALNYRNTVREAMKEAGQTPPPLGELDSDYLLMFIVPDSDPGLVIWPTHRLVYGVDDEAVANLISTLTENFELRKESDQAKLINDIEQCENPAYGLILNDDMYFVGMKDPDIMKSRAADKCEAWQELDVSVLHLLILEDLLGIDEGKLLRKENIIYSKDAAEAISMTKNHEKAIQCGFLMRSTTMEQVKNVSYAGEVMPQKSTYFFPKVLSGMVFNLFS